MLSTPIPETILRDGHIHASDTTVFSTCKSLHINLCPVLPKVSSRYLLVVQARQLRGEILSSKQLPNLFHSYALRLSIASGDEDGVLTRQRADDFRNGCVVNLNCNR